jgi:hypothetical protein
MVRQRHDIEEQHHVLHVPVPDLTQERYLAAEPRLFAELGQVGLAQGTMIHSALPAVMRLLARPQVELHGWIDFPNGVTVGVVAASDGQGHGVLAALDDAAVHLRPVQPDKLAETIVGLLPPVSAANGQSVSVPVDVYRDVVAGISREDGLLRRNTPGGRLEGDVRSLQRLLSRPRLGGGRIYAGTRDRVGRRYKSDYPITYLDLDDGRWLVRQQPDDAGKPWVVAVPAGPATLVDTLSVLLRTVSRE